MKVTFTDAGATVDAVDLGPLLEIDPPEVPVKMREGEITSRFETGVDADEGRFRLTFWYAGLRVRITCDATGQVLSTSRINTAPKP